MAGRAHRGVEGRLARELCVKIGHIVGGAEPRTEGWLGPPGQDRRPVDGAEEAVPLDVLPVLRPMTQPRLHLSGQQPSDDILQRAQPQ